MSEWNNYSLGGLAEITSSKRIFYSEYVDSGIPFYRSKEVINLFKKEPVQTELFITQERFNEIESKFGVPKENDILLTSVGSLGIPYLVKASDKFYFKDGNLTWFRNIDKSLLDPKYLYIWLSSSIGKQKLDEVTIGSTQAALTISGLKTIEIELPPLPEQKAIASVLSSLDDKIDLLHRQNRTLEAMAETLFRQWFIEEAKEDWDEVTVSSLFEVRDGTHDSPKQSPIGYPLVTSKHIGDGVLDFDSCYLISSDDYDKVNARSKVETGDILLSMIGTLGRTYLECDEVNYAIKNIGLFKTSQNPVWKYFIYLWLNSVQGKQFVDEHKSGSTQEYLSLGSLRGIQLKSPPNDLLLIFNAKVDNWFKKIHANTKQIQTLENLRDTLLPKLMSSEVRVQYQTEEVA